MKIYDGHTHLGNREEMKIRAFHGITSMVCGTNPEESLLLESAAKEDSLLVPAYGLHPWNSGQYQVEDMIPFIKKGDLLGEIGMDSIWCSVDLEHQRFVFLEQMKLAEKYCMPVILHTKGQEKEILDLIQPYQIPILVHWYSCEEYLEGYLEKGCFFTIGPDLYSNEAVQNVVYKADIDRLLVETDGLPALQWALNEEVRADRIPFTLRNMMEYIGNIKRMRVLQVAEQMEINFHYLKGYRQTMEESGFGFLKNT